ncbi:MAG: MBOAT family protein [Clostridiales bacterium]|nr:MBOAT family protein [Clostridiales bacterium]
MLFSSIGFLYYFLPITLILYFILPAPGGSPRFRNLFLLLASLVFYAWGEPGYVFLMIAQCGSAWLLGLCIDRYRERAKALMMVSVFLSLSGLLFFKYADFFIQNLNRLTGGGIALLRVALPIGISFYSFQIISYTLDLYHNRIAVQRNFFDFSAYVALFPQLIAGPIVRYADIARDLSRRSHSIAKFSLGVRRFILGLAKKILLANVLAELVDIYKQSAAKSLLFTWIYLLAYSLHIYFDFSGYSDMAIGLGHMLGFSFLENFNYPYLADSITDFWRRWHMSLSSWFRDYVYIPLGGNRVSEGRFVFNLMLVWSLTGFWHGADWNFMLWGLYFGVLLLIEKHFLRQIMEKAPRFLRHVYVLLLLCLSWTIFDGGSLEETRQTIGRMFGPGSDGFTDPAAFYYLRSYLVPLLIGFIGCTTLPKQLTSKLMETKVFTFLEPLSLFLLLLLSTAFIVDGSFNPFIYFRF